MADEKVTMTPSEDLKKSLADLNSTITEKVTPLAERMEKAERIIADVQAEQKRSPKQAIFPEMDPRLLRFDGSPESFTKLMGSRVPVSAGSSKALVEELQRRNDAVIIGQAILSGLKAKGQSVPDITQTRIWSEFAQLRDELAKAMDTTTTGQGSQWIPTGTSQQIHELIMLQLKVRALFNEFPMPTNPFTWPFAAARGVAQVVSQSTTVTTAYTLTDASRAFYGLTATGLATFTAKKLRALEVATREWSDDAVGAAMPWLVAQMAQAIADGWEDGIQNGDTDATHIDSDITELAGGGTSPKVFVDGLREYALGIGSSVCIDGGALSSTTDRAALAAMGVYAGQPSRLARIFNWHSYMAFIEARKADVVTIDKFGPNATVLNGQLSQTDGIPNIISEFSRADLDSTGVNSNTTDVLTQYLIVNRDAWMIGTRPGLGVERERLTPVDAELLVFFDRGDFQSLAPSSATSVAYVYNIPRLA
jgi:HK97 family phage major capsid protein